ncbi:MAG: phosphoglycerate dehydrogenase [Alphaproteobacteria bacterium]|jgi:D-3-phosphoglycerate dehydrogenase|nr:phosphoglycerate dehydrogenase [Alphaproteobacteria bacterium]OJU55695.1 MAG: phosphoglycerate dehydrogenase [Alphaproteobacteria bacterium 62-8]MBN9558143.1 phosphoglycerate dehydrogenase [Alphaproteobacteria bacterium]MBN9566410.1 phosphoglycerate dehydrogenase [Alphaproteobacteria bacterium]MBN9579467.1 phosphoglycerate dehydrogenase [Alphaproteobacteria bacterium]
MPKVLIADKLSPAALEIFKERGVEADVKTGLSKDELLKIVDQYDGMAIRSATKVTADVIAAAKKLKVVGRAGIGVDNVDIPAATAAGIIVMNTPFGNSITTAEHAIALMMALARELPAANASTQAGKWEKNRFMGTELYGKILGLIGAGNIGSIVADRARGLKMRVVAFDPYLSPERAADLGVEKVELNDLLARADFITLHTPLTPETRNIISADAINKMKKGVRIINCARGGLVDEAALKAALDSGHVAGAALDVYAEEPAKSNILFGNEKVVATPHLGASTAEAQENVALQVAEQISDYLLTGAVINALNMPSISADEAQKVKPWIALAEKLGAFAGQLVESSMPAVEILYEGTAAELNQRALTQAALAGLLKPQLTHVNMVNAPVVAKERGIKVSETRRPRQGVYDGYIKVTATLDDGSTRRVAGTVFSDGRPRLIQVKDINLDAEFAPHMLYVINEDKPGFIGRLGTVLGEAKVNIASFALGRSAPGADAIALVEVDGEPGESVLAAIRKLPLVKQVSTLSF